MVFEKRQRRGHHKLIHIHAHAEFEPFLIRRFRFYFIILFAILILFDSVQCQFSLFICSMHLFYKCVAFFFYIILDLVFVVLYTFGISVGSILDNET